MVLFFWCCKPKIMLFESQNLHEVSIRDIGLKYRMTVMVI